MTTFGAGWKKTDKNGNPYISFSIDKALLPMTIDENKRIAAYPITYEAGKKKENSPDFRLDIFVVETQEKETEPNFL